MNNNEEREIPFNKAFDFEKVFPSESSHETTCANSATKLGMLHLRMASLPIITYSLPTSVS